MKKVLVTGATGFIGRHCVDPLLARGYKVSSIHPEAVTPTDPRVQWHAGDLFDSMRVRRILDEIRPTHLLHLAWYVAPGSFWRSTENLRWVQASLDLFQHFTACGGQRVVAAGTCAEYDPRFGYCAESLTPIAPTTLYGTCKSSLHQMLGAFSREAGISYAWGRVFLLYGSHENPQRLVPSVICSLLRGVPASCTHGNQIRDFLHVDDVGTAFATLTDSPLAGPVNIASGQPVAIREVVELVGRELARPELVRLGEIPAPPDDPPLLVGNNARLTSLGWRPRYSLKEGIQRTSRWWKDHLNL